MKKSKRKIVLFTVIGVIVFLLLAGGGVFIFMNNQQKQMNPLENQEVIEGLYAIRNDFVNIYLIQQGDKYIAIDAGMSESLTIEGLHELGISGDDIIAVLLTHSHGDHIGALKVFDKASIYAVNTKLADTIVKDGDTFMVGGKEFRVISTPGHTDDSVSYVYEGKYLFSGDNLSLKDNMVGLFNSVYNKSDEQQKADIKKLAGLSGIEYIFTAHYGFTDNPVFP